MHRGGVDFGAGGSARLAVRVPEELDDLFRVSSLMHYDLSVQLFYFHAFELPG